jgi:hypothetical protein
MHDFIWIFDLIFWYITQLFNGLIYSPIPEQWHQLSQYRIPNLTALQSHTQ